jgi:hypothetical protein
MARGQFNNELNETGWFSGIPTVTLMETETPLRASAVARQLVNSDVTCSQETERQD